MSSFVVSHSMAYVCWPGEPKMNFWLQLFSSSLLRPICAVLSSAACCSHGLSWSWTLRASFHLYVPPGPRSLSLQCTHSLHDCRKASLFIHNSDTSSNNTYRHYWTPSRCQLFYLCAITVPYFDPINLAQRQSLWMLKCLIQSHIINWSEEGLWLEYRNPASGSNVFSSTSELPFWIFPRF